MPGETAGDVSGWTIDTAMSFLMAQHRDHVALLAERAKAQEVAMTTALTAQQLAVAAAMASAKEAVAKAEEASNKRFESVNEFRATLSDQAGSFITKPEFAALLDRVARLESRIDSSMGVEKGQQAQAVSARAHSDSLGLWIGLGLATGVGLVSLVVTIIINITK